MVAFHVSENNISNLKTQTVNLMRNHYYQTTIKVLTWNILLFQEEWSRQERNEIRTKLVLELFANTTIELAMMDLQLTDVFHMIYIFGSLSKHDVDRSENVIWKCNLSWFDIALIKAFRNSENYNCTWLINFFYWVRIWVDHVVFQMVELATTLTPKKTTRP